MKRKATRDGIRRVRSGSVSLGRLLGVAALAGAVLIAGCGTSMDTPAGDDVTSDGTQTWAPTEDLPADDGTPTVHPSPAPEPSLLEPPEAQGDSAWFAAADNACGLAIDMYRSWKAQAGSDAAPEVLALGAASAATQAADTIDAMPQPMSAEALDLRESVVAWATAYRDLALAMDSGTYSEVIAAGDDIEVAADGVRGGAGTAAPSCLAMIHDV
ncbi:hypothetical protein GCM10023168_26430 [Fodinibacter luteus]|uniref:Lipoprotein n=1 Tax=Fodinibacter luteus TaxID=552064 RepID=A0ABP8KKG7_9MICO